MYAYITVYFVMFPIVSYKCSVKGIKILTRNKYVSISSVLRGKKLGLIHILKFGICFHEAKKLQFIILIFKTLLRF